MLAASLCVVLIACMAIPPAAASGYGTPTEIEIAPGMKYTYKPTFPAPLTPAVTIHEQGLNGATNGDWGSISSGTLNVNVPGSAKAGDTYTVVLKATTVDPTQELYIPIKFLIQPSAAADGDHPNIVIGQAVSLTPTVSGMGTFTWSVTSGHTLPDGLSLNSATGKVTGTATTLGTNKIYLTATSSFGEPTDLVVTFNVVPVLAATNSPSIGAIHYVLG